MQTESKRYVIKLHRGGDGEGSTSGYGVHTKDGQIISGHPSLEQAVAAMKRYIERDKRHTKTA